MCCAYEKVSKEKLFLLWEKNCEVAKKDWVMLAKQVVVNLLFSRLNKWGSITDTDLSANWTFYIILDTVINAQKTPRKQ